MKNLLIIIIAVVMLTACKFEVRTESHYETSSNDSRMREGEDEAVIEPVTPEPSSAPESPTAPSHSSSSYSHGASSSTSSDNMRGFDPASEDDSDDNGMSRYMDNDDDEGWD